MTKTHKLQGPTVGRLESIASAAAEKYFGTDRQILKVMQVAETWAQMSELPAIQRAAARNLAELARCIASRDQVSPEKMANLRTLGCRLCQHIHCSGCTHAQRGNDKCILGFITKPH